MVIFVRSRTGIVMVLHSIVVSTPPCGTIVTYNQPMQSLPLRLKTIFNVFYEPLVTAPLCKHFSLRPHTFSLLYILLHHEIPHVTRRLGK